MTGRHRRKGPARGVESHVRRAPQPEPETELKVAVAEIERVLDTPLHELLEDSGEQEAAEAAALVQEVREVPAVARFRRLLAFVGKGRPATQAGNLKLADARELVAVLGTRDTVDGEVRSMGDLPDVAHALRWAVSAELLAVRGQRLLPGPLGEALETDPLTAWLKVAFALLENGVLGGFQEGWRPGYVEMLDGSVPGLLVALAGAGQPVALGLVQESAWEDVAGQYGYRKDNERERHRVDVVIEGLVAQLADAGVVARDGDEITLTPLGGVLAGLVDVIAGLGDEDEDDLDLVEEDALSLLEVCGELGEDEAFEQLARWCQARRPEEAADELCRAVLELPEPALAAMALEAFSMLAPAGEPAVRRLREHPRLRPLASVWLVNQGLEAPDAISPEDTAAALVEALALGADADRDEVVDLLAGLGPPDEQVAAVGVVARSGHPDATRVLRAIATGPAHPTVARAARRSLYLTGPF